MNHLKTTALILTAALPLTAFPIVNTNNVQAATVAKKHTKHTYTGTGSGSLKRLKKTAYHSKNTKGKLYKAAFMADKPTVTLTEKATLGQYNTTWYVTKKISVKIHHGKERTYYYITSSDKKVSGWTWSGNLQKGKLK